MSSLSGQKRKNSLKQEKGMETFAEKAKKYPYKINKPPTDRPVRVYCDGVSQFQP